MKNLHNETEKVKHSELTRASEESIYRSICPKCDDGYLLVSRDQKTFKLLSMDFCISCGQGFEYLDINELRKMEGYK